MPDFIYFEGYLFYRSFLRNHQNGTGHLRVAKFKECIFKFKINFENIC